MSPSNVFYLIAVCLWCSISYGGEAQWSQRELNILRSLSLTALPPIPKSLSNRFADNDQVAKFGQAIFFDSYFSNNQEISCATCHIPSKYFTDQLKTGVGIKQNQRNTPTVVASGWLRWFYWDGRRDSLWSQALIPFEAADEMGSSRRVVVWKIGQHQIYRNLYEKLFGPFPNELLSKQKPLNASSLGDAKTQDNWYRISREQREQINKVFVNIGKAIAAYERTLIPKATRYDKYIEQLLGINDHNIVLTSQEEEGIKLFINKEKTQCLQCHNGALLTNGGFHNIGSGNFHGDDLDFGRAFGVQAVLISEFNCLGNYSDAKKEDCHQLRFLDKSLHHIPLEGSFKVPSLRNLGMTAPYFHDGRFESIEEVLDFYNHPPEDNGVHELKPMNISDGELASITAFLEMLNLIE